jgi:hypothetical protein
MAAASADSPASHHPVLATLSTRMLKALIAEAGLECADCTTKSQLRARALEAKSRLHSADGEALPPTGEPSVCVGATEPDVR